MKPRPSLGQIDLEHGIVPISKAAASLAELIKRAREQDQSIVVTQNGYPSAVIVDIRTYTRLRELAEQHLNYLESLEQPSQE